MFTSSRRYEIIKYKKKRVIKSRSPVKRGKGGSKKKKKLFPKKDLHLRNARKKKNSEAGEGPSCSKRKVIRSGYLQRAGYIGEGGPSKRRFPPNFFSPEYFSLGRGFPKKRKIPSTPEVLLEKRRVSAPNRKTGEGEGGSPAKKGRDIERAIYAEARQCCGGGPPVGTEKGEPFGGKKKAP